MAKAAAQEILLGHRGIVHITKLTETVCIELKRKMMFL
jgi:hypothetical protein